LVAASAKKAERPLVLSRVSPDKYRAMSKSGDVSAGATAAATYDQWAKKEGEALGPLSGSPSIAPGGNPMLNKSGQ
jgi:hypothetical protein